MGLLWLWCPSLLLFTAAIWAPSQMDLALHAGAYDGGYSWLSYSQELPAKNFPSPRARALGMNLRSSSSLFHQPTFSLFLNGWWKQLGGGALLVLCLTLNFGLFVGESAPLGGWRTQNRLWIDLEKDRKAVQSQVAWCGNWHQVTFYEKYLHIRVW